MFIFNIGILYQYLLASNNCQHDRLKIKLKKLDKKISEKTKGNLAEEEKRFQKLDEMIRNQQKAREEIAASREKRRFFRRKRKER